MSIPVIIVSEEKNTTELFECLIKNHEAFKFLAGTFDFSKVFNAVNELNDVLILVDISVYQEQALNFISKITAENQKCKVVALSDKPDVDLVIRAMRVGACDFLTLPVITHEFELMMDKILSDFTGKNIKKSKCKIITVYSNKGGVGKTSIASNLAFELSKITKENVALIDLNFQSGDITTFLNLKPSFNISYMLQNINKINKEFLLSSLEKYKNTSLYILADPPYFKQGDSVSAKNLTKLFEILRDTFSYVVIDTSAGFDKNAVSAIENSDLTFLATIVNLPALRNCQRCLEFFDEKGICAEKIQVLINRFMENDEIKVADVEEVLGKKIYWKIPNNYFTMMAAINKGVPVSEINPDSNVALSYKNLALMVSDDIYRQKLVKKVNHAE